MFWPEVNCFVLNDVAGLIVFLIVNLHMVERNARWARRKRLAVGDIYAVSHGGPPLHSKTVLCRHEIPMATSAARITDKAGPTKHQLQRSYRCLIRLQNILLPACF